MKSKYRSFLNDISCKVKLSYYCNLLSINPSNLYQFLKGNDDKIESSKLDMLIKLIKNDLYNTIV